jgi:tripeptidyl-peptidase-1
MLPLLAFAADRVTIYNRRTYPPTWNLVGRCSKHQRMHFSIAVKQQNLDKLNEKFWSVSDPSSAHWQQFMSRDDIGAMVASKPEDMNTVIGWLREHLGKDAQLTQSADAVDVRASVADVETLFDAEIYIFTHDNGHTILRVMGPHSVPQEVNMAIDLVEGIADFPMHRSSARKRPKEQQNVSATPLALVSPETLLTMYKVPADRAPTSVSQGPAEFQDDTSYNKADLKTFFTQMDQPQETVSEIVGPYDGSMPDTEATLDVQYITSIGKKQVNWYWTSQNWMYQWAHNFFNASQVPDAVSISWGWAEDQQCTAGIDQSECQTLGVDSQQFVARVNTEFQKIGLRGVSLFVASGDSGANGRSDGACTDKVLHASFPASSPYVTAVGATMLQDPQFELQKPPSACSSLGAGYKCASGGTEVSVSAQKAGFTSGGGFSTYTEMPAYQKTAVDEYLSTQASKLPPSSYFNSKNRAYPDVSAMGNNFLIYMASEGGWQPVGGTSASSPTFAGVSAYLNDLSYKVKGKPLGCLNPLLYQMHQASPEAFTDVTIGDNKCTEDGCFASCKGYMAARGWDPVSGLGTPVADKMIAYVSKLLNRNSTLEMMV